MVEFRFGRRTGLGGAHDGEGKSDGDGRCGE
jgi:hypothetical protein